jgi:hypothetical protein
MQRRQRRPQPFVKCWGPGSAAGWTRSCLAAGPRSRSSPAAACCLAARGWGRMQQRTTGRGGAQVGVPRADGLAARLGGSCGRGCLHCCLLCKPANACTISAAWRQCPAGRQCPHNTHLICLQGMTGIVSGPRSSTCCRRCSGMPPSLGAATSFSRETFITGRPPACPPVCELLAVRIAERLEPSLQAARPSTCHATPASVLA